MNQVRHIAQVHWHPFLKIRETKDLNFNLIDLPPSPHSLPENKDWQQQGLQALKGPGSLRNSEENEKGPAGEERAQFLMPEMQKEKKGHMLVSPKISYSKQMSSADPDGIHRVLPSSSTPGKYLRY